MSSSVIGRESHSTKASRVATAYVSEPPDSSGKRNRGDLSTSKMTRLTARSRSRVAANWWST